VELGETLDEAVTERVRESVGEEEELNTFEFVTAPDRDDVEESENKAGVREEVELKKADVEREIDAVDVMDSDEQGLDVGVTVSEEVKLPETDTEKDADALFDKDTL